MDGEYAIRLGGVSKSYRLYEKNIDRLKEILSPGKKSYHKLFYALHDVSFDIRRGETVGIIGVNGSGKSTLLKIISGIVAATAGTVEVNGRISAMLELGAGFNPDYNGLQNIFLNGSIMGYSREEMETKLPQILDFADIGEFISQPVKTTPAECLPGWLSR
jgi:teichoic acid transport system ATP-binding protein